MVLWVKSGMKCGERARATWNEKVTANFKDTVAADGAAQKTFFLPLRKKTKETSWYVKHTLCACSLCLNVCSVTGLTHQGTVAWEKPLQVF